MVVPPVQTGLEKVESQCLTFWDHVYSFASALFPHRTHPFSDFSTLGLLKVHQTSGIPAQILPWNDRRGSSQLDSDYPRSICLASPCYRIKCLQRSRRPIRENDGLLGIHRALLPLFTPPMLGVFPPGTDTSPLIDFHAPAFLFFPRSGMCQRWFHLFLPPLVVVQTDDHTWQFFFF